MGARELLHEMTGAGFTVEAAGDKLLIRPASKLTDDLRNQLRAAKPELLQLLAEPPRPYRLSAAAADAAHAEPWDDAAIGRFLARVAALRRRGFAEQDADDLAERLHLLDVQAEGRALCLSCRHLAGSVTGWRCGNHRAADVARDLPAAQVTMPQDCPGFTAAAADTDRARNLQ